MLDFSFDPNFAIRGLHYGKLNFNYFYKHAQLIFLLDFDNGWLMKIDNMANIQLNTVYGKSISAPFIKNKINKEKVGREPIQDIDIVMDLHKGRHISPDYLQKNMFQLSDLFSIPQATLLSDIVQYFRDHNMR